MKKVIVILLVLMMVFSSAALAEQAAPVQPAGDAAMNGQVVPEVQYSLTTGLPTDKPYKALAVQFDNTADARPQMNMSYADVIYEMEIHNGGYTRYTAIYNDNIPDIVEAVRSARIMHVDAALDWSAAFVHFGAQYADGTNAQTYAEALGVERFDGMKDGKNFYRDNKRVAPYNAVARLAKIHEQAAAPAIETVHTPLQFSAENPTIKGKSVSVFRIPYGVNIGFYPSYEYMEEEGVYRRFYNRKTMKDGASGDTYDFENVIVMYAEYSWYDNAADRPVVELIGTNKCEYFIGGKHFTGTWVRESADQSTTYYDEEGNVVLFKPGKTFIQVVKPSIEIEIVK